jgi:hypothetical protein
MTTYNVHIYREMKLRFDGIEASTPEAAADHARDLPTEEATPPLQTPQPQAFVLQSLTFATKNASISQWP